MVMRARMRYLPLVALAGLLAGFLPGLAAGVTAPSTASFTARDLSWEVTGTAAHQATIAMGGTVSFAYPSGASAHNADFGASAPSACTQTAGASSGAVPPLPASATGPGWTGTCTFTTAGTYTFHCDLHPSMTGTVVVVDPDAPPPSTTTTTGSPSPPPTTTGTTNPDPAPPATTPATTPVSTTLSPSTLPTGGTTAPPPAADGVPSRTPTTLTVARRQRGTHLRGSVAIGRPGRLTIELLATLGARRETIGRAPARTVPVGARRFSITIGARAQRALRRRGHLTVTVRATLVRPGGSTPLRDTATVTLRPATR